MFQFKLGAVLNYRRQVEDIRQQELARSREEWEKETRRLEGFYEQWKLFIEDWRAKQKNMVSVKKLELYHRYMLGLKIQIEHQAERVRQCLADMDAKRQSLLSASKDKKMMEKLEEYHFAAYRKELDDRERKFNDEVATKLFNYRNMAS